MDRIGKSYIQFISQIYFFLFIFTQNANILDNILTTENINTKQHFQFLFIYFVFFFFFFVVMNFFFSAFFSSRNLSTAIFFTLNNFWLFDRKYFYQTFRSYVQRIIQVLPHSIDYRIILPSSFSLPLPSTFIHSLTTSTVNRSMSLYNEHNTIFRSFTFRKFMPNISLLSIAYAFHYHLNDRSINHSYILSNIIFAIQLIFTSTNCNILYSTCK